MNAVLTPIFAVLVFLLVICAAGLLTGCGTQAPHTPLAPEPPAWVEEHLRGTVEKLAGEIGERNLYHPQKLDRAADWIEQELQALGYETTRQPFRVDTNIYLCAESSAYNIEARLPGTQQPEKNIVLGAHYDSRVAMAGYHEHWPPRPELQGTPGANDNASGVAALLTLARSLAKQRYKCTVRLVFFANEEPPFFKNPDVMGSSVYAKELRARGVQVETMLAFDTVGCYSARPCKKRTWFAGLVGLPAEPDYVAFLSNWSSAKQAKSWATAYSAHSGISARTSALPMISKRIGWSDDWSFWQQGFTAFCVTDTAFLRSDDYHELSDTPDKLDYPAFAQVVWGIDRAVREFAEE